MSKRFYDYNSKSAEYGTARIDPFYYEQPPLEFVDGLKQPLFEKAPDGFGKRAARAGEVTVNGIYVDEGDFCGSELLYTAFEDFKRFAEVYKIGGNTYPVRLKQVKTEVFESYTVTVSKNECMVESGDTEGIRRAIIYIEDELRRREGAFLKIGQIKKSPWMKTRITRGYFSPTNRAPKFGDELSDDIDYYPDEYLNRLAHDGTNGIWIYTSFRALLDSKIITEYGEGGSKRLKKLRDVVKKCALYGIKVYVFAIEPMHLVGELADKYARLTGGINESFGQHAICTSTDEGKAYLSEAVEKLFTLVEGLGGYIDITAGERVTTCASYPEVFKSCPRCSRRRLGDVLAETANVIKAAIERSGIDAQFISWTYGHRDWQDADVLDYVRKCDTGMALMQNFEENSYANQLGKTREGKDYWLSHIGPGKLFDLTAKEAKKLDKTVYAKMQICASHELATVPYVPAPGLIFEKYKLAKEYGTTGVMQCWYFGNYPSVMSKAAGELAFCDSFTDKSDFLKKLAAVYYGKSNSERVAAAWELFEEGYSNYPLNIMFSYYGPMHDGVVWQLQLKPKDNYLPRSWQLLDALDGDRIHEALWQGHTLDEALTLSKIMSEKWNEGLKLLPLTEKDEGYTVAAALGVLFESGRNILRFYKLRRRLGLKLGSAEALIKDLRSIVNSEIDNSRKMISLCALDNRLGYHSEAEGFKFFPRKLEDRISKLNELLATEFSEVEDRIKRGLSPLEFYDGMTDGEYSDTSYFMNRDGQVSFGENNHAFSVSYDEDTLTLTVNAKSRERCAVSFEFEPLVPSPTLVLTADGEIDFVSEVYSHHSNFGDKLDREREKYTLKVKGEKSNVCYTLTVKRNLAGWKENSPLRLRLSVGDDFVKKSGIKLRFLAKWDEYPDTYTWLIP